MSAGSATPTPQGALPVEGEVLAGKYRIERCIGRGGMGAVFQARHEVLGNTVAIKLLLPEVAANPAAVTRFLNEARASAQIHNEHVARVLDVDSLPNGSAFMVLEYLDGLDLATLVARQGPITAGEAAGYLLQALQAVAQAHAIGIVHRDLKPANLFLAHRPDGTVVLKVLDFGISKAAGPVSGITNTHSMLGSPSFMSPEQVRSSRSVDARSDIWSLGICLYELVTGQLPFKGESFGEVLAAILEHEPPPPSQIHPAVPRELDAVVVRCLKREREERWASAAELAEALAPLAPESERGAVERIKRILSGSTSQKMPVLGVGEPMGPPTPPPPGLRAPASASRDSRRFKRPGPGDSSEPPPPSTKPPPPTEPPLKVSPSSSFPGFPAVPSYPRVPPGLGDDDEVSISEAVTEQPFQSPFQEQAAAAGAAAVAGPSLPAPSPGPSVASADGGDEAPTDKNEPASATTPGMPAFAVDEDEITLRSPPRPRSLALDQELITAPPTRLRRERPKSRAGIAVVILVLAALAVGTFLVLRTLMPEAAAPALPDPVPADPPTEVGLRRPRAPPQPPVAQPNG